MFPSYDFGRMLREPGLDYLTVADVPLFRDLVKQGDLDAEKDNGESR